ncbi:Uncharacterised protein g3269 [Pycnogonum litorale]
MPKIQYRSIISLIIVAACFTSFSIIVYENMDFGISYGRFSPYQWKLFVRNSQQNKTSTKDVEKEYGKQKWIIVFAIDVCTDIVRNLEKYNDWNLLIVHSNASECFKFERKKNLHFIHDQSLWKSHFKIKDNIQNNNEGLKNLAYLYAIKGGAKYIFEASVTAELNITSINMEARQQALTKLNYENFNVLTHYGQTSCLPRGFYKMLGNLQPDPILWTSYRLKYSNTFINHHVIENNLDVYSNDKCKREIIDLNAPPFVLEQGTASPFGASNTLIHYEAFWSLLLQPCLDIDMQDIARSYWTQYLLWLIDGNIMFTGTKSLQAIKAQKYKYDLASENKLKKFQISLRQFKCHINNSFEDCVIQLSVHLTSSKICASENELLIRNWINDLKSLGYQFPERKYVSTQFREDSMRPIMFFPKKLNLDGQNGSSFTVPNKNELIAKLNSTCFNYTYTFQNKSLKDFKPMFSNVLLIIMFLHSESISIPLETLMYKVHFPNMIVCGLNQAGLQSAASAKVSYFPARMYPFYSTASVPDCLINVMRMNYNVDGYLMIHDDVMLNFWHFDKFNKQKVWYLGGDHYFIDAIDLRGADPNKNMSTGGNPPWFFHPEESRLSAINALTALKDSSVGSAKYTCHRNLLKQVGFPYRYINGQSDILYVPQRLRRDFIEIMTEFSDRDVWFEIAVTTVMRCIEHPNKHEKIPFGHIYGSSELKFNGYKQYKSRLHLPYYHPFKLDPILRNDAARKEVFCSQVVNETLKRIYHD